MCEDFMHALFLFLFYLSSLRAEREGDRWPDPKEEKTRGPSVIANYHKNPLNLLSAARPPESETTHPEKE